MPPGSNRLMNLSSIGQVFQYEGSKLMCSGRSVLAGVGDESILQAESAIARS